MAAAAAVTGADMGVITDQGMHMPKLGLGTWRLRDKECEDAVRRALGLGYRHLDTAEMYDNEAAVGAGLEGSGVPRAEVHVTSKVWHDHLEPDAMRRALDGSLGRLGLEYLDLYLIHWPTPEMNLPEAVSTLAKLKEEGRVRAIGVSNFPVALMRRAVEEVGAPIACNQVEYHALLGQRPLLDYCRQHDVALVAYAPLAQGRLAEYEDLRRIAEKHRASPAQVALKWLLDQDGVAAIPKAGREESQRANLEALRINLDDQDRAAIGNLPKDQRFVNPAFAPVWDRAI